MEVYAVYMNYANENTPLTSIKFYTDKERAIEEFNCLKDEYLYNDEWEISDMFDKEDVTDSGNSIMFTHKASQTDMYINIESVEIE